MGRKRAASESDGNVSEEDDDYKLQDGEADPFASDDDEEEHEMEIDEDGKQ